MIIGANDVSVWTTPFVDTKELHKRMQVAIDAGYPNVEPVAEHDRQLTIVAGAANVIPFYDHIKGMYDDRLNSNMDFVAINGMLGILDSMDVVPDYCVMVDPQDKHARYLGHPNASTKFILASHCSPLCFDALKGFDVRIFHAEQDGEEVAILNASGKPYFLVNPGCTAGLASMVMGHALGYRTFHLFGFDGSVQDDGKHHAYENNISDIGEVLIDGRKFTAPMWGIVQMYDFQTLCRRLPGTSIAMYGDGLLPHTFNIMKQEAIENAQSV